MHIEGGFQIRTAFHELELLSKKVRRKILEVAGTELGGHLGGTFSCVDILVSLFSSQIFDFGFDNLMADDRDRFILSKGHACLAYYAFLHERKLISTENLESFSKNGGLGGQLHINGPYVDWNTGSLGHSIGICAGIARSAKLDSKEYKAITLIGDSEMLEGSNWEAIAFCGDHSLSSIIVIIDRNRFSVTAALEDDSVYLKFEEKMRAFNWNYIEVDGHSHHSLLNGMVLAKISNKPTVILANTIKGKGVSFMENRSDWHHKKPNEDEFKIALSELTRQIEKHEKP